MRSWSAYAAASAVLLALAALVLGGLLEGAATAIWIAAAVAYAVQLLAFGVLVAARRRGHGFVAGWGFGMGLRVLVVLVFAFWVTRATALPAAPALLGLVAFVFVLVLLEPIFLRIEG